MTPIAPHQKAPVYKKIASVVICIALVILIALLIYMTITSLRVWNTTFISIQAVDGKMFWGTLGLAMAWGLMKTFEGFIREFAKSYKIIFN